MVTYSYRALTAEGVETRGVVQAVDEYQAAIQIRQKCPVITSITPVKASFGTHLLTMDIGSPRIKTKSLALMCSQFAITLRSGMPVGRAMEMISRQTDDKKLKKILSAAAEDVQGGSTIAASFEKFGDAFPLTFIETIRAGEQSGTLDNSFAKMQVYYEKSYNTTEKIKSAMTYPIFVIVVAIIVLIIVMAKVIPALAATFADLGGELPLMTRIMIGMSNFFAKWWIVMIIVILGLVIGGKIYFKTPHGERVKGNILLKLPVIGKINQMNGAAQFANTMSVMLGSGLTINNAVDVTARTMDNYLFQQDVSGMTGRIEEGRPLGECIQECRFFPGALKEMCSVGEETGELDKTLDTIGDYFANEADHRTQRAVTMLEPTMLVFLALFAGFIVISIYLPIFTMYDLM